MNKESKCFWFYCTEKTIRRCLQASFSKSLYVFGICTWVCRCVYVQGGQGIFCCFPSCCLEIGLFTELEEPTVLTVLVGHHALDSHPFLARLGASKFSEITWLHLPMLKWQTCSGTPGLLLGYWALNSGPVFAKQVLLPTKPLPQPCGILSSITPCSFESCFTVL